MMMCSCRYMSSCLRSLKCLSGHRDCLCDAGLNDWIVQIGCHCGGKREAVRKLYRSTMDRHNLIRNQAALPCTNDNSF